MRKYEAAIFDLDGTLLDTLEDLKNSVNAALRSADCPERSLDEVRRFVGNGILKLMERAVPGGKSHPEFDRIFECFKEDYAKNCKNTTAPYPGIMELLPKLMAQGMKVAIVSNKADFAVKELNQYYFKEMDLVAEGERDGIQKKPAPDMVLAAAEEMGVQIQDAVYIGDSEVDIQTAANTGIPCISVTWGFRSLEHLLENGASEVVDSVEELEEHLLFCADDSCSKTEYLECGIGKENTRIYHTGVEQQTDNKYLNMYHINAIGRTGQPFDYYFASRNDAEHITHKTHDLEPEGMAIYAVTEDGRLVLVHQYRYPVNDWLYELPAGLIEAGESPDAAAIREMEEETGLKLHVYHGGQNYYRRPFFLAQGLTDETGTMIYGTATGNITKEGLEDSEDIEVVLADKEEVRRILAEERVTSRAAFLMMQFLKADEEEPFAFLDA